MNIHAIITTPRLHLREFTLSDAGFIISLLNSEGWLRFIGDRKVRTISDAIAYLEQSIINSYFINGFGLYLVERKSDGKSIGMCGLVKRDALENPDLGFAFLPEFEGQGYAYEAASATSTFALQQLGIKSLYAVTLPHNRKSSNLLNKLGMCPVKTLTIGHDLLNVYAFT